MASIYLAGPIDRVDVKHAARAWPRIATQKLGQLGSHMTFTPHYAFGGEATKHPREIESINRAAIRACDGLLAAVWPDVAAWGTPMEIGYADQLGKAVVLWVPPTYSGDLPAYLHTFDSYRSLEEATKALVDLLEDDLGFPYKRTGPLLLTNNIDAIDEPKLKGDAGYDVRSRTSLILNPREWRRIPCGFGDKDLRVAIPPGYWASPMVRSSLAEQGLLVQPTVIEQYRGPIYIFARNVGTRNIHIDAGDRIGQLVLFPLCRFPLEERDELPGSERGNNGFGSTGRK